MKANTISDLLKLNSDKKVRVTFYDGKGSHTTTVKDLGDRFLNETSGWKIQFFNDLLQKGEAETRMGGFYKLL